MADNGLITNVPVLPFAQRRQPGQKPWWAAPGAWSVNREWKKTIGDGYGEQCEGEVVENDNKGQSERNRDSKK